MRNWFRYRGVRLIVCPENYQPAAVKVAPFASDLRLKSCSRWPEKEGCDQACVHQIEDSPERTALQNIVDGWFKGKRCHYCRQLIDESGAALTPEGKVVDWTTIAPEEVPNVFAVSDAVCKRCFIVESFRVEHPDLVIERIHPAEQAKTIAPTPNIVF